MICGLLPDHAALTFGHGHRALIPGQEQDAPRLTAGRRTKEIGIRKVFGASTRDLVILLLWQFSIPALIANAIAWPVAWYYLHGWLQGFAYRIALSPLYFLGAGTIAILIAWGNLHSCPPSGEINDASALQRPAKMGR